MLLPAPPPAFFAPAQFSAIRMVYRRQLFIAGLLVPTHYATCLVRFGRVFFGLGQVVLAAALARGGLGPGSLAWAGGALGVAAIPVILARPDEPERYRPIFHLNAAWMFALGVVAIRAGAGG